MFGFFKSIFGRKEVIVFAEPFKAMSMVESVGLAGAGSAVFITVLPLVSSSVGAWLACTTAGCATAASATGGFAAGSSASATTVGIGSYLYYKRYKSWTIKEAGKYIINNGKLEKVVPVAFVMAPVSINPIVALLLVNAYSFTASYLRTKSLLDSTENT